LLTIIRNGVQTAEAVELRVANWFDQSMDRLSGAYRRSLQLVGFIVGVVLVTASNADTLTLVGRFWSDPIARQAHVAMAQKNPEACKTDDTGTFSCGSNLFPDDLPVGWTKKEWNRTSSSTGSALLKFLGLFFSALAIALGAPFWFDLLKRIAPGLPTSG